MTSRLKEILQEQARGFRTSADRSLKRVNACYASDLRNQWI